LIIKVHCVEKQCTSL